MRPRPAGHATGPPPARRLPVVSGRAVTVDLHRDALARVADPVADDLGVHPGVQRERGVGVPDVVQPDPANASEIHQPVEAASDSVRVQPSTVGVAHELAVRGVVVRTEGVTLVVEARYLRAGGEVAFGTGAVQALRRSPRDSVSAFGTIEVKAPPIPQARRGAWRSRRPDEPDPGTASEIRERASGDDLLTSTITVSSE